MKDRSKKKKKSMICELKSMLVGGEGKSSSSSNSYSAGEWCCTGVGCNHSKPKMVEVRFFPLSFARLSLQLK